MTPPEPSEIQRSEKEQSLQESTPSASAEGTSFPRPGDTPQETGATAPPVPELLGQARFRLKEPIGQGGMGKVWKADDLVLGRTVAVKLASWSDPDSLRRFELEAAVTARLDHPAVPAVYARGQQNGYHYYVMRYVEGTPFDQAIRNWRKKIHSQRHWLDHQLEFRTLVQHFLDVCRLMDYAHSRGIVHRDLKPNNIVLGNYGETVVLDWGLARPLDQQPAPAASQTATPQEQTVVALTSPGQRLGTPAYMAPEQASGQTEQIGKPTDIFLLGATLYQLLTGQAPFGSLAEARDGRFRPVRQCCPWIPAALEAVCLKAMQRDPAQRYGSAGALADDLAAWLADEPVSVYTDPLPVRLRRWRRRHRTLVATASVAALLLGLGIVLFALYQSIVNERLTQLNFALESANERLKQVNRDLETALQREKEARQQAERASERARQVIELIASNESLDVLARQRQLTDREKTLLSSLAKYYEEEARHAGTSEREVSRQARAYFNLGRVYQILGQHAASDESYSNALKLYEKLVAEDPQVPEYRQELASTCNNLGILLADLGRGQEAEKLYLRALQICEKLVTEYPQVPEYRIEMARSCLNMALVSRGNPVEARKWHSKAIGILTEVLRKWPDNAEAKKLLEAAK